MDFIKFFATAIISTIMFNKIDKKYKFRSKFHNHQNKHFRLFMGITGILFITIEILIGLISDNYFRKIGIDRNLISFIFEIPLIFFILVCKPFMGE